MRKRIAILLAGVAVLLGVGVGPASAHIYSMYQGADYATVEHGYTEKPGYLEQYRQIIAKDKECDGNRVVAFYHLDGGSATYQQEDTDGCAGAGMGIWYPHNSVSSFRVCEGTPSGWVCSALQTTPEHY